MSKPKKPKKPTHGGKRPNSGRVAYPAGLARKNLSCRVLPRTLDAIDARVASHGTDSAGIPRSSRGLEVERAFEIAPTQNTQLSEKP